MDNYGGFGLHTTSKPSRKRRSSLNRRPPYESESPQEYRDSISLSSTPSDHVSDAPSEGNIVQEATNWREGINSGQFISRASYTNLADAGAAHKSNDEGGVFEESDDLKGSVGDNPAAGSWKSLKDGNKTSELLIDSHHCGKPGSDGIGTGTGTRFNKVKLKVGGVTHTIHTRSGSDGSSVAGISATSTLPDGAYPLHIPSLKKNSDLRFMGEKAGLRGVPWKNFSKTGFSFGKVESFGVDIPEESVKKTMKLGRSSKSKYIVKKYSSDEVNDEEDDDEIRYLQKLKSSRIASYDNAAYEDETRGKKLRKVTRLMNRNIDEYASVIGDYDSRSVKESKKSRSVRASEDTNYMEEEESVSDGEIKHENKKQRKEPVDVSEYSKESSITTRRRATLTGRDISPASDASVIQFPDGLPPAPPRRPKEQLSEVEQQLKRTEAAQRRRIQNEKAARESEAEAIRKILGQDSSRKKREEKIKKRQEELAQERTANAATVASNVVRWLMGPSGTIVTFPDEIGLPSIFEPKPCSYPPPREKCAAPSCTNVYKYRDSKSKLPLCSLRCYKAVHEKGQTLPAC